VIAVLSIVLVCSGGGVAAHTFSDMETGHPAHAGPPDLAMLAMSAVVFLLGVFPLVAMRG
jgi:hypothetical protein